MVTRLAQTVTNTGGSVLQPCPTIGSSSGLKAANVFSKAAQPASANMKRVGSTGAQGLRSCRIRHGPASSVQERNREV